MIETRESTADLLARAVDLLRYAESQAVKEKRDAALPHIHLAKCEAAEARNVLVAMEGRDG